MKQPNDCSSEQDDATLVACVLAGSREAFDILFQRYAPSVQRLCTRLLGPTGEAQDITQEAARDCSQPGAFSIASSERGALAGAAGRGDDGTRALD